MNPEEGDLRPQLLDRLGLAADVTAPLDPAERAEAVRRRMAFDADPATFAIAWPDEPLGHNPPAALPDELVHTVSVLCTFVGAEGLRADLVICRAAAALAGMEGRPEATVDDVRRVAPLALAHRRRRHPFDDPGLGPEELDEALEAVVGAEEQDRVAQLDEAPDRVSRLEAPRTIATGGGRRSVVEGQRGPAGGRPGAVRSVGVGRGRPDHPGRGRPASDGASGPARDCCRRPGGRA